MVALAAGAADVGGESSASPLALDRRIAEFELRVEDGQHAKALAAFDALRAMDPDSESIPPALWYAHARLCDELGILDAAVDSVNVYLRLAGRRGEHYRAALRLSIRLEDKAAQARREAELEAQRQREETMRRERARAIAQRQIEASVELPGDELSDGGIGPKLVYLPGGQFCYNSGRYNEEGTAQQCEVVELASFAVAKHATTVGQFEAFVKATRYKTEAERRSSFGCHTPLASGRNSGMIWKSHAYRQTSEHPVVCVTVRDTEEYAHWLSQQTGRRYRLPGAAEWEYAVWIGTQVASELRAIRPGHARPIPTDCVRDLQKCDGVGAAQCDPGPAHCWTNEVGVAFNSISEILHSCAVTKNFIWVGRDVGGAYESLLECPSVALGNWHPRGWGMAIPLDQSQDPHRRNSGLTVGFRVVREVGEPEHGRVEAVPVVVPN